MLKFNHSAAAKLHLSDVLGGAAIIGMLYQAWIIAVISMLLWVALFLSRWGRSIWKQRPKLIFRMLSVPICLLPTVIAHYWFSDAVVAAVLLGLIGFAAISFMTSHLNREAVTSESTLNNGKE